MLQKLLLSLLVISLFSCQKSIAPFQASTRYYNSISKKTNNLTLQTSEYKVDSTFNTSTLFPEENYFDYSSAEDPLLTQTADASESKSSIVFSAIKKEYFIEKKAQLDYSYSYTNETKIKKKKKNLLFNDSFKIGLFFLIIAIGISFVGVLQLTLLFGVAAIVFLYLGLKKYYAKKRIRNFFNRSKELFNKKDNKKRKK